ncbi:synaptic vesicle glycoprotein 2B-like [Contarinia nasturtii]|uniref:synaptic vesicle glycoprotein 2B-like n=1 Tax=Contarinia nasturtii TaxID=265458 RepID=UPI0012D478A8|nr:synaptic vesicle glycoprotein 2B-like [Contarinia nasturtii]XP_031628110.1 synaptic vesicle glycoprotein 2B-like [Contarinia nasturtii]
MTNDITKSTAIESKHSTIAVENDHGKEGVEHTLEEAIEATKIGKYQVILIVASGLSILGASIENVGISMILPYIKCDMRPTLAEMGVLSSVSFLGIVSTSFLWGLLLDTWGRKKVLCSAAFLGFAFSFPSAFATNTSLLIFLRFLAGAFLAGCTAGSYSYVSEFHTSKTAPRAVACSSIFLSGLMVFIATMALLILPMDFTWQIYSLNFKPWRLFLICNSLINLMNGIIFAILPESPKFLLAINQHEKALQILKRIYAFNTGLPKQSYPVERIKSESIGGNSLAGTKGFCNIIRYLWCQTKPIFLPPLLTHTWKLCFLFFVLFAIGHGTFMWFPDFLVQLQNYKGPPEILCKIVEPKTNSGENDFEICDTLDNKNTTSYQIMLGIGVFFMLTGAISSYLLKKISPKKIVGVWIVISSSCCLAINFFTDFKAIVSSFILFVSSCSCANIVMSVAVNLYPTQYKGMASATILMFGRLGGFFGSNLVGVLLSTMCTMIFYANGTLLISCIFIFMTIKSSDKSANKSKVSDSS